MSQASRQPLLIATTNPGKLREFRALLPPDIPTLSLLEAGIASPEETGRSFREIADAKALHAARVSEMLALADDSGLEVDVLRGAPGVRSARFAGEPPDEARNRTALLHALDRFAPLERSARFVCAVTIASPAGHVWTSTGELHGTILDRERGSGGFGYDAIFELPDGRTVAELLDEEKNAVSHRGQAVSALIPQLHELLSSPNTEQRPRR
jgi:XTP/dITP diphosphohydrolase